LATLSFAPCFPVWGLVAPLAPQFQELYQLSSTQIREEAMPWFAICW
jgi:NNP family nitrate/nitrite transporter-like MFS transporter